MLPGEPMSLPQLLAVPLNPSQVFVNLFKFGVGENMDWTCQWGRNIHGPDKK